MKINNRFETKQVVFVKTDMQQYPHVVTALRVEHDKILYEASYLSQRNLYQDFELSHEKDTLKLCGVDGSTNSTN